MARSKLIVILLAFAAFAAAVMVVRGSRRAAGPTEAEIRESIGNYYRNQRATLARATRNWDSAATSAFTLYMPHESFAAKHTSQYRGEVEKAIQHALGMLGESVYPAHLRVYYVGSREEMKAAIGETYSGSTDAEERTVILVASDSSRPAHRHEIMHAVSLLVWGQPGGRDGDPAYPTKPGLYAKGGWLREGIASAADNRCGEYSYEALAAQMHSQGERLALDTLRSAFYEQDGLAAYLQAGSLVNYLLATYGTERFRRLWRSGGDAFEAAYGKSAAEIEAEWRGWLGAVPDSVRPPSIKAFREAGCR